MKRTDHTSVVKRVTGAPSGLKVSLLRAAGPRPPLLASLVDSLAEAGLAGPTVDAVVSVEKLGR